MRPRAVLEDEVARGRPGLQPVPLRLGSGPGERVARRVGRRSRRQLLVALEAALRAARLTGGLVDPTVGSALRVLGYDRDFAAVAPDGPAVTVTVGPVAGWRTVEVDRARVAVRVPPGVELDLGATAKALVRRPGGGPGRRRHGRRRARQPRRRHRRGRPAPRGRLAGRVTDDHAAPPTRRGSGGVRAGGLATSGTTVRRWVRGGTELHHLIDPATGAAGRRPVWRTVTVAAGSCVDANIASHGGDRSSATTRRSSGWRGAGLPARLVARRRRGHRRRRMARPREDR